VIALRLHLRTLPFWWIQPPLLALALAILLPRYGYWVGNWPETGAATQVSAFYLSVVAAGVAAWTSGSATRHRLAEQSAASSVPTAGVEACRLAAVTILLLLPYFLATAVAFTATSRTFPPGIQLWFGYVLMGLLLLLLAITWGWLLGKFLTPTYAGFVASLSWFAFLAFQGAAADLSVATGPAWKQPDPQAIAVRLIFLAIFVGVTVWAPRKQTRLPESRNGLVLPALGAVSVVLAITATQGVSDRSAPPDPLCVNGNIEICLWPEDVKYVPLVHDIDRRLSALPSHWRLPERLHQYGLKQQQIDDGGTTSTQLVGDFQISDGNKWGLALGVSNAVISRTLESCDWDAVRQAGDFSPEALRKWVEFYLADSGTPAYRTSDVSPGMRKAWSQAFEAFTGMSPDQQSAWTRQELDRVQAKYCA
jgi:hypothetical protein